MTAYASVGAARIQTWLLRTPELKLMRGGSRALSEITSAASVREWLASSDAAGGRSATDETADIDGVVPLRLDDIAQAPHICAELMTWLSGQLPGVEWQAWWGEGVSYAAVDRLRLSAPYVGRPGIGTMRCAPVAQDCGLVESCRGCRREPAGPTLEGTTQPRLGRDCLTRDEHSGGFAGHAGDAPKSRGARLEIDNIKRRRWAADFDELARVGGLTSSGEKTDALGRTDSRNHLATIVADGNAVGRLFRLLTEPPPGVDTRDLLSEASRTLDSACTEAVVEAANAVSADGPKVAVVEPHYLGGDDIFVSVPAAVAWAFCERLAHAFDHRVRQLRKTPPKASDAGGNSAAAIAYRDTVKNALEQLSLGIGVCFAHYHHPVHDTHDAAERAMKRAKKEARGMSARVGWVDLTEDATASPHVVAAAVLHDERAGHREVPDVFRLPPSGRSQLGAILRDTHFDTQGDDRIKDQVVDRWANRVGWDRSLGRTTVGDLPAAISRARWASASEDDDS